MYSTLQRANGVFSFLTTVLFVLAGCIALTSYLIPSHSPSTNLRVSNWRVMNGREHRSSSKATEFAFVNFDLDADLSPLFNWNVKQVFAFVVADYSTPKYPSNQVTLWDKIMNNPEEARIQLYSASQKYKFSEITGSFRHVNATYSLRWNVVPWVGFMQWGKSADGYITLPPPSED